MESGSEKMSNFSTALSRSTRSERPQQSQQISQNRGSRYMPGSLAQGRDKKSANQTIQLGLAHLFGVIARGFEHAGTTPSERAVTTVGYDNNVHRSPKKSPGTSQALPSNTTPLNLCPDRQKPNVQSSCYGTFTTHLYALLPYRTCGSDAPL